MVNLTRLSVLIADSDSQRSREIQERLAAFGVRRAVTVTASEALWAALQREAFDLLLCADPLGETGGAEALGMARRLAPATRTVLMRGPGAAADTLADSDALPLPPSTPALQEVLERTAAPQGGLWCEMPELSLADILHIYHQARRSITVLLSGPIAGRVRLEGGEIVDAESNELRGMAALSRLLEADTGLLRTQPASAGEPQTIWAPFESALLEAAQQLDERRRDSQLGIEAAPEPRESSQPPRPAETAVPPPSPVPASPAPRVRDRGRRIMGGVLATLALAAAAAYLELRRERREGTVTSARPQLREPRDIEQTARALSPAPSAPSPSLPPVSTPREPDRARSRSTAAPAAAPAASSGAESFELRLTSKPSRATVTEAGKVLGKTPLTLKIPRSSVADGPREFVLRSRGHRTARVSQGAADGIVRTHVVLGRRTVAPPAPVELPDAGNSQPGGDGSRDDPRGGPGKDLRIRSRR